MARARYWKLQFHEKLAAGGPDLKRESIDTVRSASAAALAGQPGAVLLSGAPASAALAALSFETRFLAGVDPTAPASLLKQSWWLSDGASQVSQRIALDLQYALADLQLPSMAKACELSGLEACFPYLADAVVAFAARLAPQQKLDGVKSSPFFRDAVRALLPRSAALQH